jgi:hypothetical protein
VAKGNENSGVHHGIKIIVAQYPMTAHYCGTEPGESPGLHPHFVEYIDKEEEEDDENEEETHKDE